MFIQFKENDMGMIAKIFAENKTYSKILNLATKEVWVINNNVGDLIITKYGHNHHAKYTLRIGDGESLGLITVLKNFGDDISDIFELKCMSREDVVNKMRDDLKSFL